MKFRDFIGVFVLGFALWSSVNWGLNKMFPNLFAVSVPVTFTDGSVLTAAQLNSVNSTIYNAFNGHDHDGSDGEPSTLSPSAIDTNMTFTNATGINVGDGTGTATDASAVGLTINSDTGDARMTMQVGNSSSTSWQFLVDNSDSDHFELSYNGGDVFDVRINGNSQIQGTGANLLVNQTSTGDASLKMQVNDTSANQWQFLVDNDDSDKLELDYAGAKALEIRVNAVADFQSDVNVAGGLSTDGNSSDKIAWETYTGTTCTPANCQTTVDSTPPSNIIGGSCSVGDGTTRDFCGGVVGDAGGAQSFCYLTVTSGVLRLDINNAAVDNETYDCVVWYTP